MPSRSSSQAVSRVPCLGARPQSDGAAHITRHPALERLLDLNTTQVSGVNFTDTTAITVGGKIAFQNGTVLGEPGDGCFVRPLSSSTDPAAV